MSAQPTAVTPVLEGEEAGPTYGTAQHQEDRAAPPDGGEERVHRDQVLMNGVDHRREEAPREAPREAEPRVAGPTEGDHQSSGALDTRPVELNRETTVSRPIQDAGADSDFFSMTGSSPSPRRVRTAAGSHRDQPHQAERTVEMAAYSHEAAEGAPGVRWVARLTEFLRATTVRTQGLQGRVLEGLGLTATQGTHPTFTYPQQQRQQQQMQPTSFSPIRRIEDLNFSPSEELPPEYQGSGGQQGPLRGGERPGPPRRQDQGRGPSALFTPEQTYRLRQLPREAPLIYPHTTSSTSSEEVQAEVQRQLARYVRRYEGETDHLRGQVRQLRSERDQLLAASMVAPALPGSDRAYAVQEPLPGRDRAYGLCSTRASTWE